MAPARGAGMAPLSRFTSAAAALIRASARTSRRGKRTPLTGKFSTARWVWAPHRAVAGTFTVPRESVSTRKPASLINGCGVAGSLIEEDVVGQVGRARLLP